jgi:hypothetical protein
MIEQDTVRLLRECDAGVKMGVDSIEDVIDNVESDRLRAILEESKREHKVIECDVLSMLDRAGDDGKSPGVMARGMSHVMTEMKLMMNNKDATVADLMTDGCNMGVKSLSKYLNEYKAASEASKDVAKRLISLEEKLAKDIRGYL